MQNINPPNCILNAPFKIESLFMFDLCFQNLTEQAAAGNVKQEETVLEVPLDVTYAPSEAEYTTVDLLDTDTDLLHAATEVCFQALSNEVKLGVEWTNANSSRLQILPPNLVGGGVPPEYPV